jgi:hypothetical protein
MVAAAKSSLLGSLPILHVPGRKAGVVDSGDR